MIGTSEASQKVYETCLQTFQIVFNEKDEYSTNESSSRCIWWRPLG
jgi:hypothetical protein